MNSLKLFICLASMAFLPGMSYADSKPTGSNCNLTAPPKEAGEIIDGPLNGGLPFAVFPRAKDINKSYSGCQAIWSVVPGAPVTWPTVWKPIIWVEIVNGSVARAWSPVPGHSEANKCRFDQGRLVAGESTACTLIANFPLKSMRPGCLKSMLGSESSTSGSLDCRKME